MNKQIIKSVLNWIGNIIFCLLAWMMILATFIAVG